MLVFGGSLGARSINLAAVEGLAGAPYRVLHVAGQRDFAELAAPDERYLLRDYLTPFGTALAAADLAVARSGGSVFELAQYGLPGGAGPVPARLGRPPDAPTRAGWPTPAPRSSSPTPSSRRSGCAARSTRSRSTPSGCAR